MEVNLLTIFQYLMMVSSWLQNTHTHLAVTAIISGSLAAIAILGLQRFQHQEKLNKIKKDIPAWGTYDEQVCFLDEYKLAFSL